MTLDAWMCPNPSCGAVQLVSKFCEACGAANRKHPEYRVEDDPGLPSSPKPRNAAPAKPAPASPPSDPQTRWSLVATADREYFDLMRSYNGPDAPSLQFPDECPSRRFPLNQPRLFIGRRSRRRGIDPDIDLSEPPEDPGVSHAHAMIVAAEGWSLVDVGSSNGTYLNGSDEPAPIDTPVPLNVGDRICLGAWTRLTVVDDQRDSDAEAA